MQVAFTIFQSGNRANGGVESITKVIEHASKLEPIIVTQRHTPVNDRWRRAGAEVHVWSLFDPNEAAFTNGSLRAKARRIRSMMMANIKMYRLLQNNACRVLHCNDSAAMYHTILGGWLAGAATVHNIRDTKPTTDLDWIWKWQLARQFLSQQVVLSKEMRHFWKKAFGLDRKQGIHPPIDYIYSIVDPEEFSPVSAEQQARYREDLGIPEDEIAIAYIAGVNPKKAQLKFITCAGPHLAETRPDAKVYFVGDFDPDDDCYSRRCLEAVHRLDLQENFEFVGFDRQIARWYHAVDIGLLASREEGLARCMIESLGCGTPVVSFDVCSAREILEDHQCGLVAEQGDYTELVNAAETLLSDDELYRKCSDNGAETVRNLFSPEAVIGKYETMYQRLYQSTEETRSTSQVTF